MGKRRSFLFVRCLRVSVAFASSSPQLSPFQRHHEATQTRFVFSWSCPSVSVSPRVEKKTRNSPCLSSHNGMFLYPNSQQSKNVSQVHSLLFVLLSLSNRNSVYPRKRLLDRAYPVRLWALACCSISKRKESLQLKMVVTDHDRNRISFEFKPANQNASLNNITFAFEKQCCHTFQSTESVNREKGSVAVYCNHFHRLEPLK